MGNSLQDQLLKAGLVNLKQVNKAKQEKQKEHKEKKHQSTEVVDANKLQLQRAQAEKAERDRQLNLQRQAEEERKAILAQIRQLVEANRQERGSGDVPYHFMDNNKVKRIYVTDAVRERIVNGKLMLVKLDGRYELVLPEIAEKIRQRDEKRIIKPHTEQQGNEVIDDFYAAYKIPDDLIW